MLLGYRGIRKEGSNGEKIEVSRVFLKEDEPCFEPLPLFLDRVNHSPSGFDWGYLGSGPSQLAFAILYDFSKDLVLAKRHYQEFKLKYVSQFKKMWNINCKEVSDFLEDA